MTRTVPYLTEWRVGAGGTTHSSAKRSGKRTARGSFRRAGKQQAPLRMPASSPELVKFSLFSSDDTAGTLNKPTDLFSLFHNLREDEHESSDLTRSLPTFQQELKPSDDTALVLADKFSPSPWTLHTAFNPPPTKRSGSHLGITV